MLEGARLGRIATHTPRAEALRGATQRRQAAALKSWQSSGLPEWLTEHVYETRVQPALRNVTVSAIASALNISTKTAGHHVQHVLEKLGVTTRAAATMIAMKTGLAQA